MHVLNEMQLGYIAGGMAKAKEGKTKLVRTSDDECSFIAFTEAAAEGFVGGGIFGGSVWSKIMASGVRGAAINMAVQDLKCGEQVYRDGKELYHVLSGKGIQPDGPLQPAS